MAINVLAMIHGIIPNREVGDHKQEYSDLWNDLVTQEPQLKTLFARDPITVEWGHEQESERNKPSDELDLDHKLYRAQEFIHKQIAYDQLRQDTSPNNRILKDTGWPQVYLQRRILTALRDDLFVRGLGDSIYFSSKDGEQQIRNVVYGTILEQLEPYVEETDVRIHLVGHSLGVTLCHDFLYGLFASEHDPDFLKEENSNITTREQYDTWRQKAKANELQLGSLTSTASQLAIFLMRSQSVVNLFANETRLQASDIGITDTAPIKWNLFYDVDDVLAYGTRKLYDNETAIQEIQIDTSDNVRSVHGKYWINQDMIDATVKLLLSNSQ